MIPTELDWQYDRMTAIIKELANNPGSVDRDDLIRELHTRTGEILTKWDVQKAKELGGAPLIGNIGGMLAQQQRARNV